MPKRVQINLGAVRQMVRLVKVLIRILLARLSQLAFPRVRARGERFLEGGGGSSEMSFQNLQRWRELSRRGLDRLFTTIIQGESIRISNNHRLLRRGKSRQIWWRRVLSRRTRSSLVTPVAREGSPEMGLRQVLVQEPQTTRWPEEIISKGGWIGRPETSSHAGLNLEGKLREEVRRLEGEMSQKLKLEDKGKQKMEEVKKGIKIEEKGKEEEDTMEED